MKKLDYEPDLVFYLMEDGTYIPKSRYSPLITWLYGTEEAQKKKVGKIQIMRDMERYLRVEGKVTGTIQWKDILARNFLKAGQIEYAAPKVAMLYKCTYEEAVIMCCEALKKLAQSEQILRPEDDPIDCLLKSFKKSYD